jgi:hypothetical protein
MLPAQHVLQAGFNTDLHPAHDLATFHPLDKHSGKEGEEANPGL